MRVRKILLSKEGSAKISVYLFVFYSFYYDIIDVIPNYLLSFFLCIISLIFALYSMTNNRRLYVFNSQIHFLLGWLTLMVGFLFIRNRWIENGMFWRTIRWCWAIIIIFCLTWSAQRINRLFHNMIILGFPNVLATIWFYVFPNTYSTMYRIWNKYPAGTANGRYVYKAGLCNHYSHNGIMISIVILLIAAELIAFLSNRRSTKWKRIIPLFFMSAFALVLTAKRAHFIFCLLSIVIVYFISLYQIDIKRVGKTITISLSIILLYIFAYNNILGFSKLEERLLNTGEDASSLVRIGMWKSALDLFRSHPIIGIGWGGFRYSSTYGVESHNVYLELLVETGIIGFTIYLATMGNLLFKSIYSTRHIIREYHNEINNVKDVVSSVIIIFFFLMYSFTGNCLYDITFDFLAIAIAAVYVNYYKIKTRSVEL